MALGKQAKILTKQQIDRMLAFLALTRNPERDNLIFLLSIKAGLRAKEIAEIRWSMVLDADGNIGDSIALEDYASKGRSGRVIPLNRQLRESMIRYRSALRSSVYKGKIHSECLIRTQRGSSTCAQVVVNMFKSWYAHVGLQGCSSHSGRRTFITNAARRISTVGGSLRDVQCLAGHSSLNTTQRYIESDTEARRKIVDLV